MRRLSDEQIHEMAREMAIHFVEPVVNMNWFAMVALSDFGLSRSRYQQERAFHMAVRTKFVSAMDELNGEES